MYKLSVEDYSHHYAIQDVSCSGIFTIDWKGTRRIYALLEYSLHKANKWKLSVVSQMTSTTCHNTTVKLTYWYLRYTHHAYPHCIVVIIMQSNSHVIITGTQSYMMPVAADIWYTAMTESASHPPAHFDYHFFSDCYSLVLGITTEIFTKMWMLITVLISTCFLLTILLFKFLNNHHRKLVYNNNKLWIIIIFLSWLNWLL